MLNYLARLKDRGNEGPDKSYILDPCYMEEHYAAN